jgi:hypothetical protein
MRGSSETIAVKDNPCKTRKDTYEKDCSYLQFNQIGFQLGWLVPGLSEHLPIPN